MSTYYIAGYPVSDELYHHGIKGQRWGVRRYQNEDGSLTPAGRARYGTVENYNKAQAYKAAKKEANKSYDNAYNKSLSALSPIKQHRENNKKRWEDYYDKAKAAEKAKNDYKQSKASVQNMSEVKARNAKIKKAAIIGASVVATAAVAYGGYKLAQANPDMVMYGKYKIRQMLGKTGNNVKADWSDKPGDDDISKMAKAGLRSIDSKYSDRAPSSMSDIRNKGSNEAFSKLRDDAIRRSNDNYADRIQSADAAVKREQELGRERREILRKQFDDTYKLLKDEQKELKKNKKKKVS